MKEYISITLGQIAFRQTKHGTQLQVKPEQYYVLENNCPPKVTRNVKNSQKMASFLVSATLENCT